MVRVDKRWAPDEYYIKISDKRIIVDGKIVTDDGKEIIISRKNLSDYSIMDANQH